MQTLIIFTAKYLYIVIALFALGFFISLKREDKIKMVWLAILASVFALVFALIGGHIIYDPRPFVVDHVKPLIPHAADNGFPSDHTLVSALAAFLIFVFNRKVGSILLLLSVLVGASRVLAGIHHPLDIAGSIVIALASVSISLVFLQIADFYIG